MDHLNMAPIHVESVDITLLFWHQSHCMEFIITFLSGNMNLKFPVLIHWHLISHISDRTDHSHSVFL